MAQLSPLIIIYADQAGETPSEQLSLALGEAHADIIEGIMPAVRVLAERPMPPAYMVIDIGSRGMDMLGELDALAEHCDPSIRVVVTGRINDVGFYRELRKRGVIEYFPYPLRINDMRDTLRQQSLVKSTGTSGRQREGVAITFTSAASGDGASTVALNTAFCLAHTFGKPTVIVDMDYQFGMIARQLDLNAPFGIRELIEYPDRGVDSTLISKMLCPYGENLKVIAAPNELRRMPSISASLIRDMVGVLKSEFAFVIIDVPHTWADWSAAILAQTNQQVLVSQLWLRSLTHLTRLFTAWSEIGINKQDVSLVVNRSGAKFKEAITPEDVERISGKAIDHYLVNDIKTIVEAENQGKTVMELGPSLLERQVRDLTQSLLLKAGMQVQAGPLNAESKKPRLLWRKK